MNDVDSHVNSVLVDQTTLGVGEYEAALVGFEIPLEVPLPFRLEVSIEGEEPLVIIVYELVT